LGIAKTLSQEPVGFSKQDNALNQLQRASALNIIINAISVWNTLHLTKAIQYQKEIGNFNEDLLHHMSPLGWEHINRFWCKKSEKQKKPVSPCVERELSYQFKELMYEINFISDRGT
jgi:hypothetical protein